MRRRYRRGDPVVDLHRRALRGEGVDPSDVPEYDDLHDVEGSYLDAGGKFLVVETRPAGASRDERAARGRPPGGHDSASEEGSDSRASGARERASDGEVVAIGGYKPRDETTVELLRIAVAPGRQGEGLGRKVVVGLEERARADGYERAFLETAKRQANAVAFYPALGYAETGRRQKGEYELLAFEKRL